MLSTNIRCIFFGSAEPPPHPSKRHCTEMQPPPPCRHCGSAEVRYEAPMTSSGASVRFKCSGCESRSVLGIPTGGIKVGDIIWRLSGGTRGVAKEWAVVRGFRAAPGAKVSEAEWHVQRLSTSFMLPTPTLNPSSAGASTSASTSAKALTAYKILDDKTFRLLDSHGDWKVGAFVQLLRSGHAGMVPTSAQQPGPSLIFANSTFDHLSVPPDCPTFAASCPCSCPCLDPWGGRGHSQCKSAAKPSPVLAPDGSCRWSKWTYRPGDLAWLKPKDGPAVDAELVLVRRRQRC